MFLFHREYPFLFCLLLLLGCSDTKPIKSRKPQPVVVEENSYQLELTGKHKLLVAATWALAKNQDASQVDSMWVMHVQLQADKLKTRDTSFTKKTQTSLINTLLQVLTRIPYEKSSSANFTYVKGKFEPVEPLTGSEIDTAKLHVQLLAMKQPGSTAINLETTGMYVLPKYDHQNERTKQGKLKLDRCLKSKITLKSPRAEAILDHKIFGAWLSLDDSMEVKVDLLAVQKYMEALAIKVEVPLTEVLANYPINDTTYHGEEPAFNRLSITNEMNALVKLLLGGKVAERELVFQNIGIPHGIKAGLKDFVEVSIEQQKLWLFKAGNLLLETNVVTGNRTLGRSTPKGTYAIRAKAKDVVLRGADYATPVSYWMPFHNGYGLHDANWRRKFGSTIYISNGSHGCVNMPTKLTPFVFANVEVGTPVIIR